MFLRPKVPANDCIEEARAAAKCDRCRILQHIAAIRMEDADTPLFKTLLSCGEALNIPLKNVKLGDNDFEYPVLLPKDVLDSISKQGFIQKLIGVPLARASSTLINFWRTYRQSFPQHDVFGLGYAEADYANLIPYFIHGDGGRTFKKDSILICSMYPALGRGSSNCQVSDMQPSGAPPKNHKRKRDVAEAAAVNEVAMGINLLGSSLGNRFLFAAIHNKYIKDDKSIFYGLLKLWAQELASLLSDGFQFQGRTFKIAILGLTGDAPFLRDAGFMNRSFNNIRKSADAETLLPGVCHLCAAGKTHGPHYEDLDILSADWLPTTGERNLLPWIHPSPLLAYLPAEQRNLANFFKIDIFHVWYAGVGKDFCGSSLVFMLRTVMKKANKNASMIFLNQELSRFQSYHPGEGCHFGKLSWDLLDYDGPRSFPQGKWSKGMDTGTVTKFIEFLVLEHLLDHEHSQHGPMLVLIRDACSSIGVFLRTLFSEGFFLTEQGAHKSIAAGYAFLQSYGQLAKTAMNSGRALYKLKPKAHSMAHLVLEMLTQFRCNKCSVCNPVASSTFMCEDFIGRVARLSRRVSPRVQGQKVINRYLTALKAALHQEAWSEKDREKRGYAGVSRNDCFWDAVSLRPFIDRWTRPQVYIYMYTYAHIHVYTNAHIHIYTHRYTLFSTGFLVIHLHMANVP